MLWINPAAADSCKVVSVLGDGQFIVTRACLDEIVSNRIILKKQDSIIVSLAADYDRTVNKLEYKLEDQSRQLDQAKEARQTLWKIILTETGAIVLLIWLL